MYQNTSHFDKNLWTLMNLKLRWLHVHAHIVYTWAKTNCLDSNDIWAEMLPSLSCIGAGWEYCARNNSGTFHKYLCLNLLSFFLWLRSFKTRFNFTVSVFHCAVNLWYHTIALYSSNNVLLVLWKFIFRQMTVSIQNEPKII